MHCAKNNLDLRIKTEPVAGGLDALACMLGVFVSKPGVGSSPPTPKKHLPPPSGGSMRAAKYV